MKKINEVRAALGITQEEMSLLLRVNRSQWSMYELGQRELPTKAHLLLMEMTVHLASKKDKFNVPEAHQSIKKEAVENLLRENQYQQESLARKIAAAEKKYRARLKRLEIFIYLSEGKLKFATAPDQQYLDTWKDTEYEGAVIAAVLRKLELNSELLEQERLTLESKLKEAK